MLKTLKLAKKFSTIFIIFMLKTTLKTLVSSLFDKISRHIERVFNMLKIKMDKNTKQLLLETTKLFSKQLQKLTSYLDAAHFSFRVEGAGEDCVKEKLNALSDEIEQLKLLIDNKNRLENLKGEKTKEKIYAKFKKSVKKP